MMKLTVLGSGNCELRRERSSPAYLLEIDGRLFMLDLGQGAWRRFLDTGADPFRLEAVFISHHHLDHLADLLPLLFALRYDPGMAQNARVHLLAHQELEPILHGLAEVLGRAVQPPEGTFHPHFLSPGQDLELGGLRITTAPARHIATSLAFRLEHQGRSLVYLGDSAYDPGLVTLARGAGLLVAHCAASEENPKHLHPAAAGRLAAEAEVETLLLSHLNRHMDPGRAVADAGRRFSGRVLAARDLMTLEP